MSAGAVIAGAPFLALEVTGLDVTKLAPGSAPELEAEVGPEPGPEPAPAPGLGRGHHTQSAAKAAMFATGLLTQGG